MQERRSSTPINMDTVVAPTCQVSGQDVARLGALILDVHGLLREFFDMSGHIFFLK